MVLGEANANVYLSSRNVKGADVVTNNELSTYGILNAQSLVLLENAVAEIETNLSK